MASKPPFPFRKRPRPDGRYGHLRETRRRIDDRRNPIQLLEKRILFAGGIPYSVTTNADNGNNTSPIPGSLRAAINLVNTGPYNEIDFQLPATALTITPLSPLPQITRSVFINGAS